MFCALNMPWSLVCAVFATALSAAVGHGGSSGCYFLLDPELDAWSVLQAWSK